MYVYLIILYLLCYFLGYYGYRIKEYYQIYLDILKHNKSYAWMVITNSLLAIASLIYIYLTHPFLDGTTPSIMNIISFILIVDFFYYIYHRTVHRIPFLKKHLHETHHDKNPLLPHDFVYSSYLEHIINIFIVAYIPLLFMNVSRMDYVCAMAIEYTHLAYSHSELKNKFVFPLFIDSKYHQQHHHKGGGNYALYFNIWDKFMGTEIKKKRKR
jgi:sterol desaturase/sphingolipid hydroxylase (fatty acid hydroxylase superfamily)